MGGVTAMFEIPDTAPPTIKAGRWPTRSGAAAFACIVFVIGGTRNKVVWENTLVTPAPAARSNFSKL
jgi:hypothetical protein